MTGVSRLRDRSSKMGELILRGSLVCNSEPWFPLLSEVVGLMPGCYTEATRDLSDFPLKINFFGFLSLSKVVDASLTLRIGTPSVI